ncbi:hypothetical protein SLS58_009546 [Diplodia intermedia]|uniref:Deacetylase sirtuin-type domain-containing protein n=1 Tax=Diplodia intermedia TaxID=856260 RepID=A0ABR3TBJ1_9PEZI
MDAFEIDPGLVWQFYSYRRHMALKAKPNRAHIALAELAKKKPNFQTLSQNVDGLSQRAGHPPSQLHLLHGNLFDVKCSSFFCSHVEHNNFTDPIVPALAIPTTSDTPSSSPQPIDPTTNAARSSSSGGGGGGGSEKELDLSDPTTALPELRLADLPHCPRCTHGLLRPGVVWFGEMLPRETVAAIDDFVGRPDDDDDDDDARIDLVLVIGTSSTVYPAAGYADRARARGARVAVVNVEETPALRDGDWFFQGDAGVVVPELLRGVVGDVGEYMGDGEGEGV